jgi:XTP/dITP diphosphohydrolase
MTANRKTKIVYVTSSNFKVEENRVFVEHCLLEGGTPVRELFDFEIRSVQVKEILEVNLNVMVREEVIQAYGKIKVPCIVEHAGLIFNDYVQQGYPGGLTKAMWNALGDRFIEETRAAGRRAKAQAVVAYCDGKSIYTFEGETWGTIADTPRGTSQFYWDTIFIPDDDTGRVNNRTYAEIVEDPELGLSYKLTTLSQSSRAMLRFLEYRRRTVPELWSRFMN